MNGHRKGEINPSPLSLAGVRKYLQLLTAFHGLPWWLNGNESSCNAGDMGPGPEDALEEGMATHSSILAWRTLRAEEPDGLQSTVGHD